MEKKYSPLIYELIAFIRKQYSPQEKVKVSKDGGETIFFRKSGKSLCYVETKEGKSTVTVVIGSSLSEKVQSLNISSKAKEMFKNAKQFYDGKWLFFKKITQKDLDDIKTLLVIKRQGRTAA